MAGCAHNACRVAFVDHNERIVFFGKVADLVHGSHVAVHGEYAVSYNDSESLCLGLLQTTLKISHVSICIAVSLGFAETYAVDDGCVVQCVRNDGIFVSQERFENTAVRIEAGRIKNGVFRMEIFADGILKLFVDVLCSADETYRCHAESTFRHHCR